MRLLGHPVGPGEAAGVPGHENLVGPGHFAELIGLEEAAGRKRQTRLRRPGRAGQSRHEQDQVSVDVTAFGIDTFFGEAQGFVPQMGVDTALRHLGQQT